MKALKFIPLALLFVGTSLLVASCNSKGREVPTPPNPGGEQLNKIERIEITKTKGGRPFLTIIETFDRAHRRLSLVHDQPKQDGTPGSEIIYQETYSYDASGHLVEQKIYDLGAKQAPLVTKFSYKRDALTHEQVFLRGSDQLDYEIEYSYDQDRISGGTKTVYTGSGVAPQQRRLLYSYAGPRLLIKEEIATTHQIVQATERVYDPLDRLIQESRADYGSLEGEYGLLRRRVHLFSYGILGAPILEDKRVYQGKAQTLLSSEKSVVTYSTEGVTPEGWPTRAREERTVLVGGKSPIETYSWTIEYTRFK